LFHHDVKLDYPPPCSMEEAQRHADVLRGVGIEVSIEAWAPTGQTFLTARSGPVPSTPQLYVLLVPRNQAEAAKKAHETQ
jgi:hypothetical protein